MSHLAEVYALACGIPISKPEIADLFFPLDTPMDRVILIHSFAGGIKEEGGARQATAPAKIYDHFVEVIELLRPMVEPAGYRFYQIGGPNEPVLPGIESLVGKTTLHQCAYLVKNAALLIGNDSQWAHVRGAAGKPLVAVYGSTSKPHFPYWNDPAKTILIESHRRGGKPSYASHEAPKTINWITPEQIANAALSLLGTSPAQLRNVITSSPADYAPLSVSRRSLYIGEAYNQTFFELVPNVVVNPSLAPGAPFLIRMDYLHDEEKLAANLQLRKCGIVADQEIKLDLLTKAKANVAQLRLDVTKLSLGWIKAVKRLGIPTQFFSNELDPEKLAALRLALHGVCYFDQIVPLTKDAFLKGAAAYLNKELDKDFKWDTLRFKTHHYLLSDDKVYLSKAHWQAGRNTSNTVQNSDLIIDSVDFWTETPHHYFYTT